MSAHLLQIANQPDIS